MDKFNNKSNFSELSNIVGKVESRIIPESESRNLYIQNLKAYQFLNNNAKDKHVLDVGCGDGYGTAFLAQTAKSVIGIDYEERVIVSAQKKYIAGNLKYMHMDATRLRFKENEFDLVCSFQVIEHLPEDKIMLYLNELKRVLRVGGKLYLSTPNLDKMMKNPRTYNKNPAHCKEFKLEELRELLTRVFLDFDIFGLHPSPKYLFFLTLKKGGIFKSLSGNINPVTRFYNNIELSDFKIDKLNLKKSLDFICVCRK